MWTIKIFNRLDIVNIRVIKIEIGKINELNMTNLF
jgi:hypothetical protein